VQIYSSENPPVVSFRPHPQDSPPALRSLVNRINVYYTTGTVATCINHPQQGRTQLFRRNVSLAQLAEIMINPRVHTGVGYQRKRKRSESHEMGSLSPIQTEGDRDPADEETEARAQLERLQNGAHSMQEDEWVQDEMAQLEAVLDARCEEELSVKSEDKELSVEGDFCSACALLLPRAHFSKRQWSKGQRRGEAWQPAADGTRIWVPPHVQTTRRCMDCIEAGRAEGCVPLLRCSEDAESETQPRLRFECSLCACCLERAVMHAEGCKCHELDNSDNDAFMKIMVCCSKLICSNCFNRHLKLVADPSKCNCGKASCIGAPSDDAKCPLNCGGALLWRQWDIEEALIQAFSGREKMGALAKLVLGESLVLLDKKMFGPEVSKDEEVQMGIAILENVALSNNCAWAQAHLGALYGGFRAPNGVSLEKDMKAALRWLKMATCQGDAESSEILARFYTQGRGGLPYDVGFSLMLLMRSAALGGRCAAGMLARCEA